jgi:hypothetical protein
MCPHADVAAYEQQGWLVVAISGPCTAPDFIRPISA